MKEETNPEISKEEKRYKILKVKKYNRQIDKEESEITFWTVELGILAAGMIGNLIYPSQSSYEHPIFEKIITMIGAGVAIYSLRELISSIIKKTILTIKVDEINSELDMLSGNKKSKGMRR